MTGPLAGLRIIELAGVGAAPFTGMMLADHGAEVIRVDRPEARHDACDPLLRSRTLVGVDLKSPQGVAVVRDLARTADGLIEGFRPGVTERLGLGPDVLLADNPKLVDGRMTGWGQTGPYAQVPGHDIVVQPAPAPRYSATVAAAPVMATVFSGAAVLAELGYDAARIAALVAAGTVK